MSVQGSWPVAIYLEDLSPGRTFSSERRTITESHIVTFAGLTGDFNPIHVDAEYAATTPFGQRIAHGMLSISVGSGFRCEIDDYAGIAFLETSRRFVSPVFIGDTLEYRFEVTEVRRSRSQPDRGIVTIAATLVKQDGTAVSEGIDRYWVSARDAGPGG